MNSPSCVFTLLLTVTLLFFFLSLGAAQDTTISWGPCTSSKREQFDEASQDFDENYVMKPFVHSHYLDRAAKYLESSRVLRRATDTSVCAVVNVPLDHNNPTNGDTIPVRILAHLNDPTELTVASEALWILLGGPGEKATKLMGPIAESFSDHFANDVFVVDARGVYDPEIVCDDIVYQGMSGSEWDACYNQLSAEFKKYYPFLGTSQSAGDVKYLYDLIKTDGQVSVLYGASYGTTVAHRVSQLYPDEGFDAYVLDGVLIGKKYQLSDWDATIDLAIMEYAKKCGEDTFCASKFLPRTPEVAIPAILKAVIEEGQCKDGVDAFGGVEILQSAASNALLGSATISPMFFMMLYRLDRCTPQDVNYLQFIFNAPIFPLEASVRQALEKPSQLGFIQAQASLNVQILLHVRDSELVQNPYPATLEDYQDFLNTGMLKMGNTSTSLSQLIYERKTGTVDYPWMPYDVLHDSITSSSAEFLLISGALDRNTPKAIAEEYIGDIPHATHAVFEFGGHVNMIASDCGKEVLSNFLANVNSGGARVITAPCLQDSTLDLSGLDLHAQLLESGYNIGSIYESDGPDSAAPRIQAVLTLIIAALVSSLMLLL